MAYGTLNAGAITPGSGNTLTISETVSLTGNATLGGTANALGTVATGNLSNSAIVYPTGHILQVQTVNHTATTQLTSGGALSELTTSLRISFTPISDSSRLYFNFQASFVYPNNNNLQWAHFYNVTSTSIVSEPPAVSVRKRVHWINRTTAFDTNDCDNISMTTSVANSNKTARIYTVWHGTESTVAQFLVTTLSTSTGAVLPMNFTITEVQS